jgi:hypothetical protein
VSRIRTSIASSTGHVSGEKERIPLIPHMAKS